MYGIQATKMDVVTIQMEIKWEWGFLIGNVCSVREPLQFLGFVINVQSKARKLFRFILEDFSAAFSWMKKKQKDLKREKYSRVCP